MLISIHQDQKRSLLPEVMGTAKSELSTEHPWKTKTSKLGWGPGEVNCDAKIQDLKLVLKLRPKARVTDAKSRGGG